MNDTNGQADKLSEPLNTLQLLINAAIKGGIFNNAQAVVACQQSFNQVVAEIKNLKNQIDHLVQLKKNETITEAKSD